MGSVSVHCCPGLGTAVALLWTLKLWTCYSYLGLDVTRMSDNLAMVFYSQGESVKDTQIRIPSTFAFLPLVGAPLPTRTQGMWSQLTSQVILQARLGLCPPSPPPDRRAATWPHVWVEAACEVWSGLCLGSVFVLFRFDVVL